MSILLALGLVALFMMYPPLLIVGGIIFLIFYFIDKDSERKNKEKQKEKKNKWLDSLLIEKDVFIGNCKIRFEDNQFVINDFSIPVKSIEKISFKEEVIGASKYSYHSDGSLMCIDRMNLKEYYNDIEWNSKHYYPSNRYSYELSKKYYIAVEYKENKPFIPFEKGYVIDNEDKQKLELINLNINQVQEKVIDKEIRNATIMLDN